VNFKWVAPSNLNSSSVTRELTKIADVLRDVIDERKRELSHLESLKRGL
jgi:hypothetical protein